MKKALLPPHAKELEENVIGSIIFSGDDFLQVADILRPEMFYFEQNQIIFKTVQSMSINGDPISILTVNRKLTENGNIEKVGGLDYLTSLSSNVVNSVNIEYEGRILAQLFIQRELIKVSNETISSCYDPTKDVFESMDIYESKRDEIINFAVTKKEVSNDEAANEWFDDLRKKSKLAHLDVTGIETGFEKVNKLTAGWQKSELIILAARPAMGKTALMLKFAMNAAINGSPVLIFSLEMAKDRLISRCVSILSGVELYKIIKPSMMSEAEFHQVECAVNKFKNLPIIWDDTANISLIEISSKAKRSRRKHGVQMIFIDYLQLIEPMNSKENRERQIAMISRGLKILAKDMRIPVMALSQLSRKCEERPGLNKRPQMSDLRESGAIEQDADVVSFLFRPEYYGVEQNDIGESTAGIAEYIIGKNRNGEVDSVEMQFIAKNTHFKDSIDSDEIITDFSFVNSQPQLPSNDMSKFANWDSPMLPDDGAF